MQIKKLIEKIEGEAQLDFSFENGKVQDAQIKFGFYRGIEQILIGKVPMDALVITPRVCGICNHAHLIATSRAIEDGYKKAGLNISLPLKAEYIREFTLSCELIQNHIKWLYLTILPKLERLARVESGENYPLLASYFSSTVTKALAIFAGQWPHSSYAIPFGVTCEPTYVDIIQAQSLIDEAIKFFEEVVIGIDIDNFLSMNSISDLYKIKKDFRKVLELLDITELREKGKSHDRFIVFGKCLCFKVGKSKPTQVSNIDVRFVEEKKQIDSYAKAVLYKNRHYEVGALARGMIAKEPMVKALHKRYKDSLISRIFSKIYEVAILLRYNKNLLSKIEPNTPSCGIERLPKLDDFSGVGVVEASRGSLIHKIQVKNGFISDYNIIVPTQWNLTNEDKNEKGVAQKAIIGSKSIEEASFIFRAFDICSVCTTQ